MNTDRLDREVTVRGWVRTKRGNAYVNFVAMNDKGTLVKGTVKSVDPKGAVIALEGDIEAYLRASEISRDRVQDASTLLAVGDNVEAVIINVDRKTRNINVSIKAKDQAEETSAIKQMQDAGNAKDGTTNLGALLKAKMEQK